jgi:hypothetical protein
MPNFAIIENGKVVNIVVAEINYAAQQGWVEVTGAVGKGWDYTNGQFINTSPEPEAAASIPPTKEELLAQLNAIAAQIQAL